MFNSVCHFYYDQIYRRLDYFVNINRTIASCVAFLYLTNLVALVNGPGFDVSSV